MQIVKTDRSPNNVAAMLWHGFRKLFSGAIPLHVWATLLVASAATMMLPLLLLEPKWGKSINAVLGGIILLTLWYYQYRAARHLADATTDEKGSILAWFGWNSIIYIPIILMIALLPLVKYSDLPNYAAVLKFPHWGCTVACAALLLLLNPVLIHATAQATNANTTTLGDSWHAMRGTYLRTGLAIAIAYYAPNALADIFADVEAWSIVKMADNRTTGWALYAAFMGASGICYLFGYLWPTAIAARQWRQILSD